MIEPHVLSDKSNNVVDNQSAYEGDAILYSFSLVGIFIKMITEDVG